MAFELRGAEERDDAQLVEVFRAADDTRVVSEASVGHWRRTSPPEARALFLVAEDAGRVVAWGGAGLERSTTTRGAAWASVAVVPDRRREGIGSAVGERLLDHLRTIEARKVTTFLRHTEEAERWATAHGFARVITGPLIAVDPRNVSPPEPPPGFGCASLAEVDPRAVYEVMREAALDEPSANPIDNYTYEQFMRSWDDPDFDRESSAAVVTDEGAVVSFSFLRIGGDRGQHGFTGTARAMRGRGLATAAKRYALRAAAARGVVLVTTSNAEQNAAMRAVNRRLGFEPIGAHVYMALELD